MSNFPEVDRFLRSLGNSLDGKPLYRLIWGGDAFEWRKGTFREFYGPLFLRESSGIKKVPKYPFAMERWILEKYFPESHSEELPDYDHYEPIFVFQDKNFNPLAPVLRMVELLVNFDRNCERGKLKNESVKDDTFFKKLEESEFNEILDSIDSSPIASLLHTREAIIKP